MKNSLPVESYDQLSDIEHILQRPDMYLSPLTRVERLAKCYDLQEKKIKTKCVTLSEALEHIFLEILGNASDNVQRSKERNIDPKQIEVYMSDNQITVKNYGMNIPVAKKQQWIPYIIFGVLRTSSNYDDKNKRFLIGKNGFGAKLTNVYSKFFYIECADAERKLIYKQSWYNNMSTYSEPIIEEYTSIPYTLVSFVPDFSRFGTDKFDIEAIEIFLYHCLSVSFINNILVIFNNNKFLINDIFEYTSLYFSINKQNAIKYKNETYDLCLVDTPDNGTISSFVNGINTKNHGIHVDAVYKFLISKIVNIFKDSVEGVKITKRDIDKHISIFISCRLDRPNFKGQTKEELVSFYDNNKLENKLNIEIPDNIVKNIKGWKLIEKLYNEIQKKQLNKLKKKDGKRNRPKIEKAEHANLAGTKKSHETTLILTEGKSAKSYAVKFLSEVPQSRGRDYFGVLPLKGKILNTLNASFVQILNNQELNDIKAMLGLKEETDYTVDANFKKLNYGKVLFITDPDDDGKHILGLGLLYFLVKFPTLVSRGYIKFLRVPVLRLTKNNTELSFYTYTSYNKWRQSVENPDSWHHSYFKGLGSCSDNHIKKDYKNPKIVTFVVDEKTREKITLAFSNTQAEDRKKWLSEFVDREILEVETFNQLPISTFIDNELITYSLESITRCIPEAIDGLKESQRKVLFAAMRKLGGGKKEIKVCQLANYAAEITCYKHGEKSLSDCIQIMTQDFIGSNNLPFFVAHGQFGTRNEGGKDCAQPRYTKISLPWWIKYIYRKEDQVLEERIVDEGEKHECKNFFPILPVHVINGVQGIGTAYSTSIPAYNPKDVIDWFKNKLTNKDLNVLTPWYRGHTGKIELEDYRYKSYGKIQYKDNELVISELPIFVWTHDYDKFLEDLQDKNLINYYNYSKAETVCFVIDKMESKFLAPDFDVELSIKENGIFILGPINNNKIENLKSKGYFDLELQHEDNLILRVNEKIIMQKLGLIKTYGLKNMTVLYKSEKGVKPITYDNINNLLNDFYELRLQKYQERKNKILEEISKEILDIKNKIKFIKDVINDKIVIRKRSRQDIYKDMEILGHDKELLKKITTDQFNNEGLEEILNKQKIKEFEYNQILSSDVKQTWLNEINEFLHEYTKHYDK